MSECRGPGCTHPGCNGDRSDPWFLIGMSAAIFAVVVGSGIGIYLHFVWHLPDNIARPVASCSMRGR